MISGDLDVAIYGDMPALVLASKFSGVTFIAMDNSAVQQGIVVQKDAGINSVEDLRGKRVIAETGTTCQKFLISLLESAGMTQDEDVYKRQPSARSTAAPCSARAAIR